MQIESKIALTLGDSKVVFTIRFHSLECYSYVTYYVITEYSETAYKQERCRENLESEIHTGIYNSFGILLSAWNWT